MNILFIGHFEVGSTSRMRGLAIKEILNPSTFKAININIPILETNRLFRSIGWRFYLGPLIWNINKYIRSQISSADNYDLVWVDKGVFIEPSILQSLKKSGAVLVHSTPDTAFMANRSPLFYNALPTYDFCLTTKSFELEAYKKAGGSNVLFYPQGYDKNTHFPRHDFSDKEGVAFVGLYEPWRAQVIDRLLQEGITVKLAGVGWHKFAERMKKYQNLRYSGTGLFGSSYGEFISSSCAALGLLSRKFPELHTTRTIEIPACGTALITEDNAEIRNIFTDEDVIYFSDPDKLAGMLPDLLNDKQQLLKRTNNGYQKIISGNFEYRQILNDALVKMRMK
ncbi:glycosyltransferase [Flavihumibacter sp. ZG627]|uniref:CgeB family protein n=1 Tax=Flavihumibacter sp. ZG627 TaxID=1463156 RepID=UPI00057C48BE|nr:glycosyltransferase [Flavihumibacter sp. ZG627]KIC92268.1 hypothetical protein HY58_01585 [Flavihumibacter sp. ZG627]